MSWASKWLADVCHCDPCWTDRDRHSPDCHLEIAEEALRQAIEEAARRAYRHCPCDDPIETCGAAMGVMSMLEDK